MRIALAQSWAAVSVEFWQGMPQLGAKRGCSRSVFMMSPNMLKINNQLFSNLFGCGGVPQLHGFPVGQGLLVALAGIPITIVDAGLASVLATLCRFRFARWLGLGVHHVVFIFDRHCLVCILSASAWYPCAAGVLPLRHLVCNRVWQAHLRWGGGRPLAEPHCSYSPSSTARGRATCG